MDLQQFMDEAHQCFGHDPATKTGDARDSEEYLNFVVSGQTIPLEPALRPRTILEPLPLMPPGCWGDPSTMEQCPHEAASDSARQDRVSTCPWDVTARKGVMAGKTGPWPVVQNRHYSSGSDPSRADSPSTTPVLAQSD